MFTGVSKAHLISRFRSVDGRIMGNGIGVTGKRASGGATRAMRRTGTGFKIACNKIRYHGLREETVS